MFNKLIGGDKGKNISNSEERDKNGEKRTIQTEDGV